MLSGWVEGFHDDNQIDVQSACALVFAIKVLFVMRAGSFAIHVQGIQDVQDGMDVPVLIVFLHRWRSTRLKHALSTIHK